MILTVTPNPALDITYHLDSLTPGTSINASSTSQRAGGKGINVSRLLKGLGEDTVICGLIGGDTGQLIASDLDDALLRHEFVPTRGETRRTVALVTPPGLATIVLEPGPVVSRDEWDGLLGAVRGLLADADVMVLSGSLPVGVPSSAYAELVAAGVLAGVPVLLDTRGPSLAAAMEAGPSIVKPNQDELRDATPDVLSGDDSVLRRMMRLRGQRPSAVVCSLGSDGLVALVGSTLFRGRLRSGTVVSGNPTGAGDAVVAALAVGESKGSPWNERVRDAVALSAAAVEHPVAGTVDLATYRRLRARVDLHEDDLRSVRGMAL